MHGLSGLRAKITSKTLSCLQAISRADKGQIDADLGSGVIKQRIARTGQGKSGGYRTIILFRKAHRAFFVYGFAKSDQENISNDEEKIFKQAAKFVLNLSDAHIVEQIEMGKLTEVITYDEEI